MRAQVCLINDVYFEIYDSFGNVVRSKTKLTNDAAGWRNTYVSPSVTRLKSGDVIVTYADIGEDIPDIYFVVMNGAGNVIRSPSNVSNNGYTRYDNYPTAAETADGRIVFGYSTYESRNYTIRYAVASAAFNLLEGPAQFAFTTRTRSQNYVSITTDGEGRAVLTWMDGNWDYGNQLFYGLIDLPSAFPSRTGAQIYFTSRSQFPNAVTSQAGFGNTTYSSALPTADGVVKVNAGLIGGEPNGTANVPIEIINHGTSPASNLVLTATLGSSALAAMHADAGALTYAGDTSGVTPTVSGNTVVWMLPNLSFLQIQRFNLYLNVPDLPYGTQLNVSLAVSVAGEDATMNNNATQSKVMVARQVRLPITLR